MLTICEIKKAAYKISQIPCSQLYKYCMRLGRNQQEAIVFKVGVIKVGDVISLSVVLYFYTKYSLYFYGKCALNVIQPFTLLGEMQIKKCFVRHFDK